MAKKDDLRCEVDGCLSVVSNYPTASMCRFHNSCAEHVEDIGFALDIEGDSSWPRSQQDKALAGERLRDSIQKLLNLPEE